jgi:hypothetical protein
MTGSDHDWHKLLRENEERTEQVYQEDKAYNEGRHDGFGSGFWIGALGAFVLTIGLLVLVGLSYNNWQLP